ncbi:hypothetical protein [Streptomyces sp. PD-S100-1]|uniref:hypothetical protein n=1 Tax=Streptomyces sp. PD-S100-1 TaxID=3394351 RepID=UPI0039BC3031
MGVPAAASSVRAAASLRWTAALAALMSYCCAADAVVDAPADVVTEAPAAAAR